MFNFHTSIVRTLFCRQTVQIEMVLIIGLTWFTVLYNTCIEKILTKYDIECRIFLSTDPQHVNFGGYDFANSNPNSYVDRDGELPIQIAPGVSRSRAKKIFKLFKKLSNDKLELTYQSTKGAYAVSIVRYAERSQLSKPSGTMMIRDIFEMRQRELTIDYNNTLNLPRNSRTSPLTTDVEGTIVCIPSGRRVQINGRVGLEFHLESDVIINLNGIRLTGTMYFEPRQGKVIISDVKSFFPKEVVLYHEMIHARYFMNGSEQTIFEDRAQFYYPERESIERVPYPGSPHRENISLTEARTIGLTPYSPRSAIEGVDLSYHPSENQLRRELRLPYRLFHTQVR